MQPPETLVIGCGALARELLDIVARNNFDHLTVECLPVSLHHEPAKITPAVRERIERASNAFDRICVGYADCGTGGHLDQLIEDYPNVERLPGAHCFEFYAGTDVFEQLQDAEPGTLYLTDYFVRHFERFLFNYLGLDRHPELLELYFGNYTRVVYLPQSNDATLRQAAREAADRIGLPLEIRDVSYGDLEPALVDIATRSKSAPAVRRSVLPEPPTRKAC